MDTNNKFAKKNRVKLKKNHLSSQKKTKQQQNTLGISLTNRVKDLHSETLKTMQAEIKEDIKQWNQHPCS